MAEGTQVRPRLFEADLPKDPRKPIRHPFDAVPYTPPDRILDEEGLLRRLMAAPDQVLWWPRNSANRLLAERMAAHGWLDGDGARGFTPSDDGARRHQGARRRPARARLEPAVGRAVLASGTHAPGVNGKGGREPWDHTRSGRLGKRAAPIQYGRVPTWSIGVHARGKRRQLETEERRLVDDVER